MIKKRIRQRCEQKGIDTFYKLQKATGISSPTVAKAVFEETYSRLSDETLDKLCSGLECQPGDLMVYVPDRPEGLLTKGAKKKVGR